MGIVKGHTIHCGKYRGLLLLATLESVECDMASCLLTSHKHAWFIPIIVVVYCYHMDCIFGQLKKPSNVLRFFYFLLSVLQDPCRR